MRVFIIHKPDGEISSVIHAEVVPPGFGSGETPVPPSVGGGSANDIISEVPAKGIAINEGVLELHKNYRYDVKKAELTKVRVSTAEKTKKAKKTAPAEPESQEGDDSQDGQDE